MPFDEAEKSRILKDIMEQEMTQHAIRAIAFSYCDMSIEQFQNLMAAMQGDIDSAEEIQALERDQVFLALVGLRDPVRDNIKQVVQEANRASIQVRLISGDNLSTTAAVAVDTGILTNEEFRSLKQNGRSDFVMDASEFRQVCGDVVMTQNASEPGQEPTYTYSLNEQNQM